MLLRFEYRNGHTYVIDVSGGFVEAGRPCVSGYVVLRDEEERGRIRRTFVIADMRMVRQVAA